jgi:hypothetical protein
MDAYEQHIRSQLVQLHREFSVLAKPLIDELARLESLRPSPSLFVTQAQLDISKNTQEKHCGR